MKTLDPKKSEKIEDRRRSARRPHVVEATLASPTARNPDDFLPVTAVNVSRHGIAFKLTQAVPEEAYYKMKLTIGLQEMTSEVRIIKCRDGGNGQFEIGAEFC